MRLNTRSFVVMQIKIGNVNLVYELTEDDSGLTPYRPRQAH